MARAARRGRAAGPVRAGRRRVAAYLAARGPGLLTGASDDDPSGIATYSIAGASLGAALPWTPPWTLPLMAGVQLVCARIGLVTGRGRARRGRRFYLVMAAAILGGALLDGLRLDPIRLLFLAALVNGLLAPPLLVLVMLVGRSRRIMGEAANGFWLNLLGWAGVAILAAAGVVFVGHALGARFS